MTEPPFHLGRVGIRLIITGKTGLFDPANAGFLGMGEPSSGGEALLTIFAFQFVLLMIVVALISTYSYHKTGRIYAGAFLNAIFLSWYIVAGQAIHFAV